MTGSSISRSSPTPCTRRAACRRRWARRRRSGRSRRRSATASSRRSPRRSSCPVGSQGRHDVQAARLRVPAACRCSTSTAPRSRRCGRCASIRARARTRNDNYVGVQEAFADVHLRNVSDRYDFDSVRVGIQPFISDFRGFLFQDVPLGVRLFGTRDNNQWQYNLAWFRRLEKDTNSGLERRDDRPRAATTSSSPISTGRTSRCPASPRRRPSCYNVQSREATTRSYDANGFLVRPAVQGDSRPHDYDVAYLGLQRRRSLRPLEPDRRSVYWRRRPRRAQSVSRSGATIRACFAAAELSRDFGWVRAAAERAVSPAATTIPSTARRRLRRDPRESAVRRRRHELLDPPGGAADRRRRRGAVGAQRRAARACAPRRTRASRTS